MMRRGKIDDRALRRTSVIENALSILLLGCVFAFFGIVIWLILGAIKGG